MLLWKKLTFSKLRFFRFEKFASRSVFVELQLTQISLNFKSSRCNLKIRGLGAKLSAAFLLFYFSKELWRFKVKKFQKVEYGKLKVRQWWVGARKRKKRAFFVAFTLSGQNFCWHLCFFSMYSVLNKLLEY